MAVLLGGALLLVGNAAAETHTVTVIDTDSMFAFVPNDLKIEVGDTVVFVWENTTPHNVVQVNDSDAHSYSGGFRSGDTVGNISWTLPAEYTAADNTL
ncbi:MAG: plastocyanin/azurin family copper-binding protein, partial [Candidatus Poseidoniia archaeon]|nr:plastocyanin/azurin family copper-binding protein [Candidatus Poseidoniia archaeon]